MIEIKDLLPQFNSILLSEEIKKDSIINILHQVIGLRVRPGDIKIKNSTVYLNIKPIYKNEIFFKKDEIFLKLKESLGKKSPRSIV